MNKAGPNSWYQETGKLPYHQEPEKKRNPPENNRNPPWKWLSFCGLLKESVWLWTLVLPPLFHFPPPACCTQRARPRGPCLACAFCKPPLRSTPLLRSTRKTVLSLLPRAADRGTRRGAGRLRALYVAIAHRLGFFCHCGRHTRRRGLCSFFLTRQFS